MAQFTLSIEPTEGKAFLNGFHLGTIESIARQIAEEKFHARNKHGMWTRTVALLLDGKLFDVYDGTWHNEWAARQIDWEINHGWGCKA